MTLPRPEMEYWFYDLCLECGLPYTTPSPGCRRHRDVLFARDRGVLGLSDDPKLLERQPEEPVREGREK